MEIFHDFVFSAIVPCDLGNGRGAAQTFLNSSAYQMCGINRSFNRASFLNEFGMIARHCQQCNENLLRVDFFVFPTYKNLMRQNWELMIRSCSFHLFGSYLQKLIMSKAQGGRYVVIRIWFNYLSLASSKYSKRGRQMRNIQVCVGKSPGVKNCYFFVHELLVYFKVCSLSQNISYGKLQRGIVLLAEMQTMETRSESQDAGEESIRKQEWIAAK